MPLMLTKANIPAESIDVFYRPTGKLVDEKGRESVCPVCQGSGYFGRFAAFELLEMTDDLKKMIAAGSSLTHLKAAARKKNMLYLQEQAFSKVIAGETSVEELIRVSRQKRA